MKFRVAFLFATAVLSVTASSSGLTSAVAPLPATLAETGLFEPGSAERVRAANEPFQPAHPLWTDGQSKRRWLYLPPGTSIDKSDPDAWEFPAGTRAWKEFSGPGRIETRLIERLADGSWRFSSYVWNAEGTEAVLAPEEGIARLGIPSRADCLACHEGAPVPILGYSAVQLGHTIAARTPEEAAALGYLHGNCGHCHNESALGATGLHFAQSAAAPLRSADRARESLAGRASEITRRIQSNNPYVRMPPLGVSLADANGIAVIHRYLEQLDHPPRRSQ